MSKIVSGVIKFFSRKDNQKFSGGGYGYINRKDEISFNQEDREDIYFQAKNVDTKGIVLTSGDEVDFQVIDGSRGSEAVNIVLTKKSTNKRPGPSREFVRNNKMFMYVGIPKKDASVLLDVIGDFVYEENKSQFNDQEFKAMTTFYKSLDYVNNKINSPKNKTSSKKNGVTTHQAA